MSVPILHRISLYVVTSLTDGQEDGADFRRWESRNGRQTGHGNIALGGDFESAVGVHESPVCHRARVIEPYIHQCAVH